MIGALVLSLAFAQDPAVAREWRAREWALMRDQPALAAALEDEAWGERHAALDALARTPVAARAGLTLHPVAAALTDAHPNVRAAALTVYASAGATLPPAAFALADDPFAPVRRALAEALSRAEPTPQGRAALLALAQGPGEVADVAQRGLLSAGPAAAAEQLTFLGGDPERLLEALPHLRRAPVAPALVEGLRAAVQDDLARTLVEALALHAEFDGAPVRADRARLARGWLEFRAGDYRHEVELRECLIETAREGDEGLARALFDAAVSLLEGPAPEAVSAVFGDGEAGSLFLVECAAQALSAERAITLSADLPEVLASEVWSQVLPPLAAIDRDSAVRWLAPEVDEELRFGVASVLADHFRRTGDPAAEGLLLDLLEDPDSGLRRAAFRWLSDGPDLEARLETLFAAWDTYEREEQVLHLRALPRDICPRPFREELLALCEDPSRRTSSLLELLGTFGDEPRVRGALRGWLEDALRGLEQARAAAEWRAHEARAAALVRALGPDSVREVSVALRRVLAAPPPLASGDHHQPELSKTCCALLGGSLAGRAELAFHLGREVENRARLEAAIQILDAGDPETSRASAAAALVGGFARCDAELGGRVLRALGRTRDTAGAELLLEVVLDPRRGLDTRVAATDALARRGDLARLREAFASVEDPEVGPALATVLARSGVPTAIADLRAAWLATRARLAAGSEDPYDVHRAGELLVAVVLAEALGPEERGLVFAGPLANAGADMRTRFRAEGTAATAFRWRAELRACELAAARGELGAWLEAAGPWWRLDGDLLLAVALAAREVGDAPLARRLLAAAEVATGGEPISEGWWNRRARISLAALQLATEAGDTDEIAVRSSALWGDLRLIDRRIASREDALGRFDRRGGVDPVANLDAGRLHARAWLALEQGDLSAARALAAAAASRVGASRAARDDQALLEAALAR